MKISKKWLEQYMDLDGLTMEQIADRITQAGFEVEGIEPISSGDNLVIGHVLEVSDHPDSDHLHCTLVDIGDEKLEIVCGAPNVAAGQKVIVAKPGANLPGGQIKSGMIRGKPSQGMICALFELGVDKHLLRQDQIDGIEILDENAPVGHTDPLGYLGYDDVVLDVSLTPNRADCMAVNNMALEIGAILDRPVKLPEMDETNPDQESDTLLKIESESENCPFFLGKVIGSVTIKPSPEWMKQLLRASGVNSINNVVDISNIVMLETGQPMHFYDIDAIENQEITVKEGRNETYRALDEVDYQLIESDMVITNADRPIGIAGIMGGNDSKIEDNTRGIIIECALFAPVSIRNTARRLGLATEASVRYQKGIEPLAGIKAMKRAVHLLKQYADAKEIEKTVVFGNPDYQPKTIRFTLDQINRHLGTDFNLEEVIDVLKRLHFEPQKEQDEIVITIPSYRMDMEGMADVSEEIIRMIGYDRLPSTLPLMEMTEGKLNSMQKLVRYTREYFTQAGLQECLTYTLVSKEKIDEEGLLSTKRTSIEISPPLSDQRRFVRTGLLPSLLEAAQYNAARNNSSINLFEISEINTKDDLEMELGIVLASPLQLSKVLGFDVPLDFYTIKGLLETYLEKLGIDGKRIDWLKNDQDIDHYHPYQSAIIQINKKTIGIAGMIHPAYAATKDLKQAALASINLSALEALKKGKIKSPVLSKYPEVLRDLAIVVDRDLPVENLKKAIERKAKVDRENVLRQVDIFDIYTGKGIEPDKKSVALSLVFQSDKQTLRDDQINAMMEQILNELRSKHNAKLRS